MILNEENVLRADFRKASDRKFVQRALRNFKSCRDCQIGVDVPFTTVEKILAGIMRKYAIDPLDFFMVKQDGEDNNIIWSCGVKVADTHSWLGSAYGLTLYEVVCKIVLFLFLCIKNKKIKKRQI